MAEKDPVSNFLETLQSNLADDSFVKLTLSKPGQKSSSLRNIYMRPILLKEQAHLSCILRYTTQDITKNYSYEEGIEQLKEWLGNDFLNANLFTLEADYQLQFSKKRKASLVRKKASHQQLTSKEHNHTKQYSIPSKEAKYLQDLGITNEQGKVLKQGQKKYKQINKYIEIIDHLISQTNLPETPKIVDMGSGKGYLTFALYDYFQKVNPNPAHIKGIELRKGLVNQSNAVAQKYQFDQLQFIAQDIHDFPNSEIDMLIALHACDIATDIAIAKGIKAEAEIIITAPCCHKQIRQQMQGSSTLSPILKHGILEERQAELITDGIRALLLEANGYKTKVFEFISNEHTSKNLMITARKAETSPNALEKVKQIKQEFGIEYHYLEKLLEQKN